MIVTSSAEVPQVELEIVHLNTYVLPAVPVNVAVGLVDDEKLPPVPETTVQAPVFGAVGVFAAKVAVVALHGLV